MIGHKSLEKGATIIKQKVSRLCNNVGNDFPVEGKVAYVKETDGLVHPFYTQAAASGHELFELRKGLFQIGWIRRFNLLDAICNVTQHAN